MSGGVGTGQLDPLLDLFLRAVRALAPFGIHVGREVLLLWRDQAAHGYGPLRAAERGDTAAVEELVSLLRLLTGTEDPQATEGGAHAGEN